MNVECLISWGCLEHIFSVCHAYSFRLLFLKGACQRKNLNPHCWKRWTFWLQGKDQDVGNDHKRSRLLLKFPRDVRQTHIYIYIHSQHLVSYYYLLVNWWFGFWVDPGISYHEPRNHLWAKPSLAATDKFLHQMIATTLPYCWWKKSCTSWYWENLPVFIGFHRKQVVRDFFQQYFFNHPSLFVAQLPHQQITSRL